MNIPSEVHSIKADSINPMKINIYKIPLIIHISDIFDSSECFKLDKDFTVKL